MITMLWVMAVAAVVAATGVLAGRLAVHASRNRAELERAYWTAAGCASRTRALIDALLRDGTTGDAATVVWRTLDRRVTSAMRLDHACDVQLEALGTRVDVNTASDEMVARLLSALGVPESRSREMVDALADWKDSDDVARAAGAERSWYVAEHREQPRNGPIADVRELARVRGFERISDFDSVLGVDGGRVSLATAPVSVLMSISGVTRETAETIAQLREQGEPVGDLLAVTGLVSSSSADSLTARYADAAHVSTATPDGWILTVRTSSGFPPNTATLTMRLVRDGAAARLVFARSDP
jgi:type II secretory pathway component PulK